MQNTPIKTSYIVRQGFITQGTRMIPAKIITAPMKYPRLFLEAKLNVFLANLVISFVKTKMICETTTIINTNENFYSCIWRYVIYFLHLQYEDVEKNKGILKIK